MAKEHDQVDSQPACKLQHTV